MEGMLMLLVMMLVTVLLAWSINGEQRKRVISLFLCAAMMSSYIPAISFAKAESIAKPVLANEQVLVNGVKSAQIGAVTYSISDSTYTIDTSSARVRVKNGDSISFEGAISAPEGETISWIRVDVYDANTKEPYTVGAEFYRASGMKIQEFDLSSIPALTIGEAFGSKDYTLVEGGKYIVMFCVGDSNGNSFADIDAEIEDDQGPAILVDVKFSPSNCKHPHSDYRYVRHSSGEIRNVNYGDGLTHQVEPLYERYCGLCDTFLMNIWGQGTPEEHTINEYNVCMDCGYYAALAFDENAGIMPLSLDIENGEVNNSTMDIHVDDIVTGQSFEITWNEVSGADHYEVSIVRLDGSASSLTETRIIGRTYVDECSYTVSASDVPANSNSFRIFVAAAADSAVGNNDNLICQATVTIGVRYEENKDMEVKILIDESASVEWERVTEADYYLYTVKNDSTSEYIAQNEKTTSLNFFIEESDIIADDDYIIWVGAYSNDSTEVLCQHKVTMKLRIGCPHLKTRTEPYSTENGFEYYDENQHYLINICDVYCLYCDELVEEKREQKWLENHSNSASGVCVFCKYAGTDCMHSNCHDGNSVITYEINNDGETHDKITTYNRVCDTCNAIIPFWVDEDIREEYVDRIENIEHTFVNSRCECGYAQAEELTVTVQRSTTSAVVGDSIGATASIAGGSGEYTIYWNAYCDDVCIYENITVAGSDNRGTATADRTGDWTFEVIVIDSNGERATARTEAIAVEEDSCNHVYSWIKREDLEECESVSDIQHRIRSYYENTCSACSNVDGSKYEDVFEDHVFDENSKCICGAVKETDPDCVHEWNSTVSETRIEQITGNDRMEKHKVTTVYADICGKCSSPSSHESVEYVAHVFDKDGRCECGYIEVTDECDHATTGVPEGNPAYENIDNDVHSVTTYERHKCECGQVNELRENTVQAEHTFEDGFCVCGLADPGPSCDHKENRKLLSSKLTNESLKQHKVVKKYHVFCECGYVDKEEEITEYEEHSLTYTGIEAAHPHKEFKRCDCGHAEYTGDNEWWSSCSTCNPNDDEQSETGTNSGNQGDYPPKYEENVESEVEVLPEESVSNEKVGNLIDNMVYVTVNTPVVKKLEDVTKLYKDDLGWQLAGGAVSNMMTGLGTFVGNVLENEKQDVLQGAIIEMLYGENGFTSEQKMSVALGAVMDKNENTSNVKDTYEVLKDGTADIIKNVNLVKEMDSHVKTIEEMRYTILVNKGLITPNYTITEKGLNSADCVFYTQSLNEWSAEDFARMRNDYVNAINSPNGAKVDFSYQKNGEYVSSAAFEAIGNKKLESFDTYVNAKKEIETKRVNTVSNKELAENIAIECVNYAITLYQNAMEAEEELDTYKAIIDNEMNNIAILSVLYESTTGETQKACGQILQDIKNNFEGWANSPAERKKIREDGKATLSFACGVGTEIVLKVAPGSLAAKAVTSVNMASIGFAVGTQLADVINKGEASKIVEKVEYYDTAEAYMAVKRDMLEDLFIAEEDTAEQYYLSELYNTLAKQEATLAVGYGMTMLDDGDNLGEKLDNLMDQVVILAGGTAEDEWDPMYSEYVINARMSNAIYDMQESQNRVREHFINQNMSGAIKYPDNPYTHVESVGKMIDEVSQAYVKYQGLRKEIQENKEFRTLYEEWNKNRKMLSQNDAIKSPVEGVRPPMSQEAIRRVGERQQELEKEMRVMLKPILELENKYNGFRVVLH